MDPLEMYIHEMSEDNDLHSEFLKYAQLRSKYRTRVKDLATNFQKRFNSEYVTFATINKDYYKLKTPQNESKGYQILSSSLFKTIHHRFRLDPSETWRILDAVADRVLKNSNLN